MKVPLHHVHPDDWGEARVGDLVDLACLRGKPIRMIVMCAIKVLGTTQLSLGLMADLGLVQRGEPMRRIRDEPRFWIVLDPASTKRSLYDAFVEQMPPPVTHGDFDRYLHARDLCEIPADELPPARCVPGMIAKMMELGTSHADEIGAFTPCTPRNHRALKEIINKGAALPLQVLKGKFRPSSEMVLAAVPALKGAPGTMFDQLLGGDDSSSPSGKVLSVCWGLGPLRAASLLWVHLAASSRRSSVIVRANVRYLALFDQALTLTGGSPDDPAAVARALECIAFGQEFGFMKPPVRGWAVLMIQVMLRQLTLYGLRHDPDGRRGLRALAPAEHPQRMEFTERVRAVCDELKMMGREARKRQTDRAANDYARMLDVAALRTEQIMVTQTHAKAAAAELKVLISSAGDQLAPSERCVEFGVPTTILSTKGKLQPGSQLCWWRAWRERDFWLSLAEGKQLRRHEDGTFYLRCKSIREDPGILTGIVYEWCGCVPESGKQAIEPWFVTFSNIGVLQPPASLTLEQRKARHRQIVQWNMPTVNSTNAGLVTFDRERNTLWRHASRNGRFVVPLNQLAFGLRFAQLGLNIVDECMSRISELMQLRQDRDAWQTSGETESQEISFLAYPKSNLVNPQLKAAAFQIEQVTFVEATGLASEIAKDDGFADGILPEILAAKPVLEKYPEPQAWIFQKGGSAVTQATMNYCLALLLANVVAITFHGLRHASANAARQAGIPEEGVQALLKHRSLQQSRWYMRDTARQRVKVQVAKVGRARARIARKRSALNPAQIGTS